MFEGWDWLWTDIYHEKLSKGGNLAWSSRFSFGKTISMLMINLLCHGQSCWEYLKDSARDLCHARIFDMHAKRKQWFDERTCDIESRDSCGTISMCTQNSREFRCINPIEIAEFISKTFKLDFQLGKLTIGTFFG